MLKKINSYFKKHSFYNAIVHLSFGLGAGILFARPIFGIHPLRYGLALLIIGVVGHLYPLFAGKK